MPWRILKQRSFPSKIIIIPKLLTDEAVLHSEQGPAKCLRAAWGSVQFSITLQSDSKTLKKLQPGAVLKQAPGKVQMMSLTTEKQSIPLLPPWVKSPQKRLSFHSPVPKAAYVTASTAKLLSLGCGAKKNFSARVMDAASLTQAQTQRSALWEGSFYTQVTQLAFLRRKPAGTLITHRPTCSSSLRNECLFPSEKATWQVLFQASNDMSDCRKHQGTNFKSNESYSPLLLQGIEL